MGQFFESTHTTHISNMYKLIVLAAFLAVSSAQIYHSGLPYAYAAGHPYAYAGAPLNYAAPIAAAPIAAAPIAAPIPAPVATQYALPPPREVQEAPLVSQSVEKVEQHGYSIRY